MSQYDLPILQETTGSKFGRVTLSPPTARRKLGVSPSQVPELFVSATGSIYTTGSAASLTVAGSATWTKVTSFTANGDATGVTPTHGTDTITISEAGLYLVGYNVSFTGTNANEILFAAAKNGGTLFPNVRAGFQLLGAALHSVSAIGPVTLAVNDTLELWFQNATAGNAIVAREACLWCVQLV